MADHLSNVNRTALLRQTLRSRRIHVPPMTNQSIELSHGVAQQMGIYIGPDRRSQMAMQPNSTKQWLLSLPGKRRVTAVCMDS
ncbi:hypothetical protein T4E_10028 [Trichinella pseudospiralis]|uniref:Uncharacterized protein n=1 Tax=Trichinella pseudospiralis TaxID=6337 RepID=A0A0V1FNR4_TRIPS|nr:hypothetical protein T4E_10028 [Trichinella pseudospiralis]KRY87612.1 hypothetical protein T4D_3232 [Trichinella pseudospiralis]